MFLELFNPLPGNKYLQITTKPDKTTSMLHDLLLSNDGSLEIAYYNDEANKIDVLFSDVKIQYLKSLQHPFRALPRDYDMVIFKDIFTQHTNPKGLLKIAYTALANTANIIIMEPKGVLDVEATLTLLETFEFRAPNQIDVLPDYDLIMAKKMHMWGNGL